MDRRSGPNLAGYFDNFDFFENLKKLIGKERAVLDVLDAFTAFSSVLPSSESGSSWWNLVILPGRLFRRSRPVR